MTERSRLKTIIEVFQFMSLWPGDNDTKVKTFFKDIIYYSSITPVLLAVMTEDMRELLGKRDNAVTLFTSILHTLCFLLLHIFSIYFHLRRKIIMNCIVELKKLEDIFESPETEKMEKKIRIMSLVAICYVVKSVTLYITFPFLNWKHCQEERKTAVYMKDVPCGFITPLHFPFDYTEYPMYLIVFTMVSWTAYAFGSVVINCLLLVFALTLHTIAHLKNLKNILTKAVAEKDEHLLNRCIEYHNAIIGHWNYVDSAMAPFSFGLLFFATVTIGILEYELLIAELSLYDICRYSSSLGAWVGTAFCLCTAAQMLVDESESVAIELYKMDWLECPLKMQKSIMFMILRSQKALMLSTGPIGQLNMITFVSILRRGYSFLAVFANMK